MRLVPGLPVSVVDKVVQTKVFGPNIDLHDCVPCLGNRSAPIYNTRATIENQTIYIVEVIDV